MKDFRKCKVILFDLDGTLSDSKQGIIHCLQYSLGKLGIVENNVSKLIGFIGPSLSETYRREYGLSEAAIKEAVGYYREWFELQGIAENRLYPGIKELLADLYADGRVLAIATGKPTVHARKIIAANDLTKYFAVVAGCNLDGTREHKDEVISAALTELAEPEPERAVMVGDRKYDVAGAHAVGMPCIGVTYGYGTEEELSVSKAERIARSVEDLRSLLLN